MKIGIDGRAAKWYRGTGIGTYTYQLINNLSKFDDINQYLTFIPEGSDLSLKSNFFIEYVKESPNINNNFWIFYCNTNFNYFRNNSKKRNG